MLTGEIAGKIQAMQKRDICDKTNRNKLVINHMQSYEGWNSNSGNYLFTTDTK